jgi:MFS family permease
LGQIVIIIGAPFVYPLEFLPQSILCIIFGLALLGSSGAFTCVAVIIQYGKIAQNIDHSLEETEANDIASAVFNLGINFGDFLGPVYGGFVSTNFGFKYSNIYMSVIAFINCIYYYLYYRQNINNIFHDICVNGFCKIRYTAEEEEKSERLDIKASRSRKSSCSNFKEVKGENVKKRFLNEIENN